MRVPCSAFPEKPRRNGPDQKKYYEHIFKYSGQFIITFLLCVIANEERRYQNFIGQSQSGTGKTAAFVLAMLRRIDINIDDVQVRLLHIARQTSTYFSGRMLGADSRTGTSNSRRREIDVAIYRNCSRARSQNRYAARKPRNEC